MGCHSESDWRRKGFRITSINGQKTITFNKNNTWLSKLSEHSPTSHTTVRAVPHTAVPTLGAIRDTNPSA